MDALIVERRSHCDDAKNQLIYETLSFYGEKGTGAQAEDRARLAPAHGQHAAQTVVSTRLSRADTQTPTALPHSRHTRRTRSPPLLPPRSPSFLVLVSCGCSPVLSAAHRALLTPPRRRLRELRAGAASLRLPPPRLPRRAALPLLADASAQPARAHTAWEWPFPSIALACASRPASAAPSAPAWPT